MFVDKVVVKLSAGDGGAGSVSFRQEKFIDKGGPDGGDGGNGGSIILVASRNQNTLAAFRYQRQIKAIPGKAGSMRNRHGRSGKDNQVAVPVGTILSDNDGNILADLTEDGQTVIVARGGRGGYGNAHFISSVHQTPRLAERGEPGEAIDGVLELKIIADVGLVGLPNAGKSTLLASISNARPEIADYPFTTLTPNLGVVDITADTSLLMADIPGLIEGASQGKGLGDDFLRHVERTAVVLHLVDIYNDDIVAAYKTIQSELGSYSTDLSKLPQVVMLSKIEGLDDDIVADALHTLQKAAGKGVTVLAASALSKVGLKEVLFTLKKAVDAARTTAAQVAEEVNSAMPVIRLENIDLQWKVTKDGDHRYLVSGRKIERFAARTEFSNYHGVQRLRDIMRRMGITHELVRQDIQPDDKVVIGIHGSFEY